MKLMLDVALNSEMGSCEVTALNFELSSVDNAPPAEMMLIPPGPVVTGRDGRSWNNPNPQGIINYFKAQGRKIPIDIEHATELKGPKGEPAPAVGWYPDLVAKPDGSIWGKTDWNPKGRDLMINREYSYYSPAIIYDKATMNIVGISSVGLTNKPNFAVPALNREQEQKGASTMELEQLLVALGLPAGTTFAAALNHIASMKTSLATALNHAENPPLDKFVPKADYDLALNRATSAEEKITAQAKEVLETAINSEIDAALKAGKITPATKDYHIAQCRQDGGLERFKAFAAVAPKIAEASDLDKRRPGQDTALNAEEQALCDMMGINVEDYKKTNNLK